MGSPRRSLLFASTRSTGIDDARARWHLLAFHHGYNEQRHRSRSTRSSRSVENEREKERGGEGERVRAALKRPSPSLAPVQTTLLPVKRGILEIRRMPSGEIFQFGAVYLPVYTVLASSGKKREGEGFNVITDKFEPRWTSTWQASGDYSERRACEAIERVACCRKLSARRGVSTTLA